MYKDLDDDRIDKTLPSIENVDGSTAEITDDKTTASLDVLHRTINWKMVTEGAETKEVKERSRSNKIKKLTEEKNKLEAVAEDKEKIKELEDRIASYEKRNEFDRRGIDYTHKLYKAALRAYKKLKEDRHIDGNPENDKEQLALTLFFVNMRVNTWKKETIEGVVNGDKKTIDAFLELKNHEDLSSRDLYSNL